MEKNNGDYYLFKILNIIGEGDLIGVYLYMMQLVALGSKEHEEVCLCSLDSDVLQQSAYVRHTATNNI